MNQKEEMVSHQNIEDWFLPKSRPGGWLEMTELELLRFLEQEYGTLSYTEKLCAVFTSQFLRAGHVRLPLDRTPKQWADDLDLDPDAAIPFHQMNPDRELLAASEITGSVEDQKPFVLEGDSLYFHRQRVYEIELLEWMRRRSLDRLVDGSNDQKKEILESLFGSAGEQVDWQKAAAALSLIKPLLFISGGPGTGKTTTVARILALHQKLSPVPLHIGLAAPTGKAAGRMGEALQEQLSGLDLSDEQKRHFPREAKTLHRLLNPTRHRGLLPPAEKTKLRYDLLVVDEASMIDLTMMHRLVTHLDERTRVIFLGDKDQLASVEAGAVFADLCYKSENGFSATTTSFLKEMGAGGNVPEAVGNGLRDSVVYLTESYRFDKDKGIGMLADFVLKGERNPEELLNITGTSDQVNVHHFDYTNPGDIKQVRTALSERITAASHCSSPEELLDFWKREIWLVALRRGPAGSEGLNQMVEKSVPAAWIRPENGDWYHGRPVMITRNDYNIGVFNGDLGVCHRDQQGNLRVFVESGSNLKPIRPERVVHYQPAYFMTVHKSQGSEFSHVHFLMPPAPVPVFTKELIYTAITRAKDRVSMYGDTDIFLDGIQKKSVRYSGLEMLKEAR
jgi:exodeoxyribonuclease V alpha subunit